MLVEGSIVARVLGIRLLTVDATLVLVPADVTAPASARDGSPGSSGSGLLADAVRCINEGAALLAETRRNGP